MKKLLSVLLAAAVTASCCVPAMAAGKEAGDNGTVKTNVTYELSVTDAEREAVHAAVDALSGYFGKDIKLNDGTYDPNSLVGAMVTGGSYNSISYGKKAAGDPPSEYPFYVPNTEANYNESSRKAAKYDWVIELAQELGLEAVQRQDDKYVYVEIGDPDAPEMIMALSHLDSPTGANNSGNPGGNLSRWLDYEGNPSQTAYYTPYVRDGWVYATGIQDDSGPTLATLFAAKALQDAGVSFDRRIRIVMGSYEDANPGVPTVENTLNYMDIPYYTSNPSFYDNWAYKSLNREETPIAAYTSDSRFPVIIGNTQNINATITYDISKDEGKAFSLASAVAGVTLREGDPTLKDIVHGSAAQMASRAIFTLNVENADQNTVEKFMAAIEKVAETRGWLPTEKGTTPKVAVTYDETEKKVALEINTGVAMEAPTPHYGKNAVVWGMYLLSQTLPEDLELKNAAQGLTDLFFPECEEGESYIGKYILPHTMLRNADDGAPNMTFAVMGNIGGSTADSAEELKSFYADGALALNLYTRQMFTNSGDYDKARQAVDRAFEAKGYNLTVTTNTQDGPVTVEGLSDYTARSLYLTRDNLLTALQFASYRASMEADPEAFEDVYGLLDISSPIGTTGGTLATNFRNKMTAFGAVIPGNERWWHSANERMKVDSVIEMTKLMADGMLEMARYSGPTGAQLMWADIEGYNADRADLDLLDVTIATYQDASSAVNAGVLNGQTLLGATKFEIPMWKDRGNTSLTAEQYALGHEEGGCYLTLDNEDYTDNTFVLPMRLEFKVERSSVGNEAAWNQLLSGNASQLSFNLLTKEGKTVSLALPENQTANADKFYSVRVPDNDSDSLYVSVNLAIVDGEEFDGVETVLADSRTDLYRLNESYLANGGKDYFPERTAATQERGFFLFGDGAKDAEFTSPKAIYVTLDPNKVGGSSKLPFSDVSVKDWFIKAVEYVYDKNLMSGTTAASFAPNAALNRAMMAQVLYNYDSGSQAGLSGGLTDVAAGAWYADAVNWSAAQKIINGYGNGVFGPENNVTREQLATILYNYAKIKGYDTSAQASLSGFTDVDAISGYALEPMQWAVGAGLIGGMGNGRLNPGGNATRAEVAQVLMQFCENLVQ